MYRPLRVPSGSQQPPPLINLAQNTLQLHLLLRTLNHIFEIFSSFPATKSSKLSKKLVGIYCCFKK